MTRLNFTTATQRRPWTCDNCQGVVLTAGVPKFCPYCRSTKLRSPVEGLPNCEALTVDAYKASIERMRRR